MKVILKLLYEPLIWFIFLFSLLNVNAQVEKIPKTRKVLTLDLDAETAYPNHFGSNFSYADDRNALVYFNQITKTLKYFDVNTGKILGQTSLETFGPNNVGQEPYYVHYHNKDSIFVFARFGKLALSLVNGEGLKIDEYDFGSKFDFAQVPYPRMSNTFGGIVVVKNEVYMGLQVAHNSFNNSKPPVIKIDMKTREYDYLKEPIPYKDLNFKRLPKSGQIEFYESRVSFNKSTSSLIITYPVPGNIFRIKEDRVEKIELQSQDILGEFELLDSDNGTYTTRDLEYTKLVMVNPRILGSIYDPYRNVHYFIRKVKGDVKSYVKMKNGAGKFFYKYLYEAYDSEFKLLDSLIVSAEYLIPNKGVFLDSRGLWVLMPQQEDEDVMQLALLDFNLTKE
ncbi:hypothetical protein [Roseivirga sp.]|uniref:hypothetical protein n=1 Tax=Roseivirga sp. TaxID=1964215 RepID=UPI003B8BC491